MDIKKQIEEFIVEEICPSLGIELEQIDDNESLLDAGILNSLGILQLLSFIDEELEIDISGEQIKVENFKDLKTICRYVESLANG